MPHLKYVFVNKYPYSNKHLCYLKQLAWLLKILTGKAGMPIKTFALDFFFSMSHVLCHLDTVIYWKFFAHEKPPTFFQNYLCYSATQPLSPKMFFCSCSAIPWNLKFGTQKTRCHHVHALIAPKLLGSLHPRALKNQRAQAVEECSSLSSVSKNHLKTISLRTRAFLQVIKSAE